MYSSGITSEPFNFLDGLRHDLFKLRSEGIAEEVGGETLTRLLKGFSRFPHGNSALNGSRINDLTPGFILGIPVFQARD